MFTYSFIWCVAVSTLFTVMGEFIFFISALRALVLRNLRSIKDIVHFESMQALCNLFCLVKMTLQNAYFHPRNPKLKKWKNEWNNELKFFEKTLYKQNGMNVCIDEIKIFEICPNIGEKFCKRGCYWFINNAKCWISNHAQCCIAKCRKNSCKNWWTTGFSACFWFDVSM